MVEGPTSAKREGREFMFYRYIATVLALILTVGDFPIQAAPEPKTEAAPAASTSSAERAPLIEVSVDALEISESNTDVLGFLWGQIGQSQNGVTLLDPNHV